LVLDDESVGFGEVESSAIDFLVSLEPADGQRSRAAKPSPEGREDRRRSGSGAEDWSALEGGPAVGYSCRRDV